MRLRLASYLLALLPFGSFATEVPDALTGIWATPNCTTATDTLVLYKGFYLWLGEDETALSGLSASDTQATDWTRLEEPDGYPNFFMVLPDGRLRETFLPDGAPFVSNPTESWQTTDYESCADALPRTKVLLHGEPVAVLKVVSSVHNLCQTDQQACANQLFAGLDISGDGKLSRAEIARVLRVTAYVAAVSEDDAAQNDDLAGISAASLPIGPLMASAIVNSFDYDNDGLLSLAELSQDRGTLTSQLEPDTNDELSSRLNQMKQAIKPLGRLLENFGQ
jgi:hypothetical protein